MTQKEENKSLTFLQGIKPQGKSLPRILSSPKQASDYSGKVRDKITTKEVEIKTEETFNSSRSFLLFKKTVTIAVIVNMVFTLVVPAVFYPLPVAAQTSGGYVDVSDAELQALNEKADAKRTSEAQENLVDRLGHWVEEWAKQAGKDTLKHTVFIALIDSLNNLLNQIAYDTATWLASGGEGEQPLFYTEGWGEYLSDAVDGAAGDFVNTVAGEFVEGLNLCEPNFNIKLGLIGGISSLTEPEEPDCSVTEMMDNFESFADDTDFLDLLEDAFQPGKNDVTISLEVYNKYYQETVDELVESVFDRAGDGPFKGIVSKISGVIKTPGTLVAEWATSKLIEDPTKIELSKAVFGDLILTPIATFLDTLTGQLFERLFEEGLADDDDSDDSDDFFDFSFDFSNFGASTYSDLYTGSSGSQQFAGKAAAELRFLDLFEAGQTETEQYDILSHLAFCPTPDNPGADECVITQSFRSAIEQELPLKEAIAKGFINGDAPFGSMVYDASSIYSGIPYRSIVILRTHRIVPVGWELAAQAISKFDPGDTLSLNDLIAQFENPDSVYYGLIDSQWVLKNPSHICKAEGFGPKIIYENIIGGVDANGDGDFNDESDTATERTIARGEYCADYQTCLEENDDGSCKYYGYCAEERRIWDLQGTSCPDFFNSCQTFQNSSGQVASYLKNSLNYDNCNVDNAGCQWYCQEFNPINDVWTCQQPTEKVLATCNQPNGCNLVASCTVEEGSYSCADTSSSAQVTLAERCGPSSQWWNGTECVVAAACPEPIPFGGVSCSSSSCDVLTDLLSNSGFEEAYSGTAADRYVAQYWSVPEAGQKQYWSRVTGSGEQVYPSGSGGYSLRYYIAAGTGTHNLSSDLLTLSVDPASGFKFYTLSGKAFNSLNAGTAALEIEGFSYDISNLIKNAWQDFSFEFRTDGSAQVAINVSGAPKSGRIWFDQLKITESCIASPVQLTLATGIEKDQSKINFDRDANDCDPQNAGCSQFIRTLPNLGTNLVVNSSFEDWSDAAKVPPGWSVGESHSPTDSCNGGQVTCERSPNSPLDSFSLKLTNVDSLNSSRDFETLPLVGVRPNTTYRISFWAKSDQQIDPTDGQWYVEMISDAQPYDNFCELARDPGSGERIECDWLIGDADTVCRNASGNPNDRCLSDWTHATYNNSLYLPLTTEWRRFVMDPLLTRSGAFDYKFSINNITNQPTAIYLDGVQIEEVDTLNPTVTGYKDYGAANQIHLKKPPDYLSCQGYSPSLPSPSVLENVTQAQCSGEGVIWREDACDVTGAFCCHEIDLPECYSYAFYCQPEEVGCESYQPVTGGISIPGVVTLQDYCPAECVGYDSYKQSSTLFENQETLEFFIPATANQCTAAEAGCDEFTNLDEVALGGEGLEYYSYLRLCEKPTEASCQNFFAWQGSDETGYQLKIYNLSAQNNEPDYAINVAEIDRWPDEWCANKTLDVNGSPECCNAVDDLATNPFCRELIAADGSTLYRIYDNTISCSQDCYPFRKTRLGETDQIAESNCNFSDGRWDAQTSACVYQAIPDQGIACSAAGAGCREYRGDTGANVFTAFSDNFEDGDSSNWRYGEISSEALTVAGHSLKSDLIPDSNITPSWYNQRVVTTWGVLGGDSTVTCSDALPLCDDKTIYDCYDPSVGQCVARDTLNDETCRVAVGETQCGALNSYLTSGRTYIISFWAKSASANVVEDVNVEFASGWVGDNALGVTDFGPEWNYYKFGPFIYDEFQQDLRLRLWALQRDTQAQAELDEFYVDNIEIKEVQNYAYVVKNSWDTPESCDTNPFVDPPIVAPQFMLGCAQYSDSYNRIHNLKSFTNLCREEAVGCEALIDTQNSSNPFSEHFNPHDGVADVVVPADSLVYLTTRPEQQCAADQKGCEAVGLPQLEVVSNLEETVRGYQTVYAINDPDSYDTILCETESVSCEEWQSDQGLIYFKNPGPRTCEYRLIPGESNYAWFKIGSAAGQPDCPLIESPVGGVHPGPDSDGNWYAGICPNIYNGCTQFIDSVSNISKSLIFNGKFEQDFNGDDIPDGWNQSAAGVLEQPSVSLEADTIYVLSLTTKEKLADYNGVDDTSIEITDCPGYSSYDHSIEAVNDSTFRIPPAGYEEDDRNVGDIPNFPEQEIDYSVRFKLAEPQLCTVKITMADAKAKIKEIALRQVGVDYVLAGSVDQTSCNGIVDLDNECVLFNDRSQVSYKIGEDDVGYLTYDADVSGLPVNNGVPITDCAGPCDSNAVLKVKPDRACDSWLYCKSSAKVINDDGGESTECLSLGLCDSLDDNGICDSNILVTTVDPVTGDDTRQDYYTDVEQISNLSGFSNAGLQFIAATGTDNIIHGYFPYAEMTQSGNSALVTNGDFETVFDQNNEPIGWSPYVNDDADEVDDNLGWQSHKYIVEDDILSALPGAGAYLKLKTSYQAQSGEIDVEKGAEYILSGWINTFNLSSEDIDYVNNQEVAGQICLDLNEINPINDPNNEVCQLDSAAGSSLCCLEVKSGADWQHLTLRFGVEEDDNNIRIILRNNSPDIDQCRDDNKAQGCKISGYSLIDEISLQPVLEVQQEKVVDNDFIDRGCRLYPEVNSLACRYYRDKVLFAGREGYCVTADPANPAQCLQWWPVDTIAGEGNDEFFSSDIPAPLYYCVGTDRTNIVDDDYVFGRFDTTPVSFSTDMYDDDGKEVDHIPFAVPAEFESMMRFPYIDEVEVNWQFQPYYDSLIFDDGEIGMHITLPFTATDEDPFADFIDSIISENSIFDILDGLDLDGFDDLLNNDSKGLFDSNISDWLDNHISLYPTEERVSQMAGKIMDRLGEIIPEEYDGYYDIVDADYILNIRDQDSEKIGLLPATLYARLDVALILGILVSVFALFSGVGVSTIAMNIANGYQTLQDILPVDFIGFYLHFVISLTGPAAESSVVADLITAWAISLNLLGTVPDIVFGLLQTFSDLFALYDDTGDWWDVVTEVDTDDFDFSDASGSFGVLFGPYSTLQVITDQDAIAQIGELDDPVEEIDGDVLGAAVTLALPATDDVSGVQGTFESLGNNVTYCKTLAQTVDASGTNKAWLARVFPGSKYVLNDTASHTGYYIYSDPYDYDLFKDSLHRCDAQCIRSSDTIGLCGYENNIDGVTNSTVNSATGLYDPLTPIDCTTDADCVLDPVCNDYQSSDFEPFGSAVTPSDASLPENFDSRETASYRQPLYYEPPLTSLTEPYQARMGEAHGDIAEGSGEISLKNIFLKSYGVWEWQEYFCAGSAGSNCPTNDTQTSCEAQAGCSWTNDTKSDDHYVATDNQVQGWDMFDAWDDDDVTGGYCSNNRRAEGEICRQRPEINPDNIKVNEESSLVVRGSDSVQLDFMVTADPNQLPIISYNVLWGDGNMTAVSGSRLRDRPNADNPFTSYHVYDHWEMQRYCEAVAGVGVCDTSTDCAQFAAAGSNVILCCPDGSNYCKTKVRIKIRDNWNAETCVYSDPDICNSEPSGLDDLQLNKYIPMSGTITVQQ